MPLPAAAGPSIAMTGFNCHNAEPDAGAKIPFINATNPGKAGVDKTGIVGRDRLMPAARPKHQRRHGDAVIHMGFDHRRRPPGAELVTMYDHVVTFDLHVGAVDSSAAPRSPPAGRFP